MGTLCPSLFASFKLKNVFLDKQDQKSCSSPSKIDTHFLLKQEVRDIVLVWERFTNSLIHISVESKQNGQAPSERAKY